MEVLNQISQRQEQQVLWDLRIQEADLELGYTWGNLQLERGCEFIEFLTFAATSDYYFFDYAALSNL